MPWIIQLIVYREVKFLQFQGQKCAEAREAMGLILNDYLTDAIGQVSNKNTNYAYLKASLSKSPSKE